jgi:dipeptidyl aminopeptidase/acylaminoacyl peptidase
MDAAAFLDALMALPAPIYPLVSRDGRWIAWSWQRAAPTIEVFVAPTDGSAPPLRLTDTAENTFVIAWTPDSAAVIVMHDHDGDERVQLFRIEIANPLIMQPLTAPNPPYFIRGGALHPDGNTLFYGANVDETGAVIEATWVYRHDLQTGARTPIARPLKGNYLNPQLSPTGAHILYNRKDRSAAGEQVWLVNADGSGDHEILHMADDLKSFASWFPDGMRVLVISEQATHDRLGIWHVGDAKDAVRWLIDDPNRHIETAYAPFGTDQIVVIETDHARKRASLLQPDTGLTTPLTLAGMTLIPYAPAAQGGWIGEIYSATQPNDLIRFDPADLRAESFTSLSRVWERTPITPADLAPARDYRWTADDGLPIQGWLYRPTGTTQGTILYVHGGPTWHLEDEINPQIQYFVHQGCAVLAPNYRGSTGFGRAFREAIKADGWGGREQTDMRAGVEALIRDGIAVAGKIGMTGTSYGGYSSWHAITHFPPDIIAASAPICGMTDLILDYETTRPDLRPYSEEMLGGTPTSAPEKFRERSPIHYVHQIRGRLLIIQGLQDPNVTPHNVDAVVKALQAGGIEYELLAFDDEGHGISKPSNQRRLFAALVAFFETAFAESGTVKGKS